ncbi:MAG TPA: FAD-dependent oxidoreductase, partial [Solirubrobacteraceae bacterium]|nr:FAD-dependent oxidoreductase [Solirubrobacteraceae bacterium]
MTTVAVLGGGVAGLSAAHELAERGFAVTVYEARDAPGGKARSIPYAGSGTGGRADLPGEHGFRFFPGFYRHLPDTMGRIPSGPRTVRDHLVGATRILFAQAGGPNEIIAPAHLPESAEDFAVLARFLREAALQVGVPPHEYALLVERLLTLLTSCDERREQQWELQSWWDFT